MKALRDNNKFILGGIALVVALLMFLVTIVDAVVVKFTLFDILFNAQENATLKLIMGVVVLLGLVGGTVVQFLGLEDKQKHLFAVIGFGLAAIVILYVLIDLATGAMGLFSAPLLIMTLLAAAGAVLNVLHLRD